MGGGGRWWKSFFSFSRIKMDGKDHLEKILLGKTLLWCGFSVSGSENKKQLLMSFDATGCTSIYMYISTCNSIYGLGFHLFILE